MPIPPSAAAAAAGRARVLCSHLTPLPSNSNGEAAPVSPAFRLPQPSPNPNYTPGETQAPPFPTESGDFIEVDAKTTPKAEFYKAFISSLVPRTVGLVSTISKDGNVANLAPYSFFNAMSFDPPVLVFCSVARPRLPGGMGNTHQNLLETGECVVNIISEWYAEAANYGCGNFPFEVDEGSVAGLTTLPTTSPTFTSGVPRIAEAAVQMECTLDSLVDVKNDQGAVTSTMCVCRIQQIHVNQAVYDVENGVVDAGKLRPIARLGGDAAYGQTLSTFDIARPKKDGSPGSLRFGPGQTAPAAAGSVPAPAFLLAQPSPNPSWVPGVPSPPPFAHGASDFVQVDTGTTSPLEVYKLMISAIVPRPIAFVSTRGKEPGSACNLSPYSFFTGVGFDPPTMVFGSIHSRRNRPDGGGKKDTHRNLAETGECVVHIISEWFVEVSE